MHLENNIGKSISYRRITAEMPIRDSPCTPHVDRGSIDSFTHQQFGTPVPQGNDPVGMVVPLLLVIESSQTKVCKLKYPLAVQQDIGALEITMQNRLSMEV